MEMRKKLFRVADGALVVYQDGDLIAVKQSEVGPWLAWDAEQGRWGTAVPEDGKTFDLLPLAGSLEN